MRLDRSTARWLAAVAGCALVAAGCSVQGTPQTQPSDPASKAAAPDLSAVPVAAQEAFWRDFTQRADLAYFHGMRKPYDVHAGREVMAGPRLAGYEFAVAYAKATNDTDFSPSPRYEGLRLYSEPFTGYPKWVLGASRRTDHVDDLRKVGLSRWNMHLFTRQSPQAEWLEQEQALLASDDVPAPLDGAAAADGTGAGAAADRRAGKAAKQLVALWEDGRSPSLVISAKLRKIVDGVSDLADESAGDAWLTFERWPHLPTRSVRATGTTLSMLVFRATLHQQARPGTYLYWTGPLADLFGSGQSSSLSRDFAVTVLLSLRDRTSSSGKDEVLGVGFDPLLES